MPATLQTAAAALGAGWLAMLLWPNERRGSPRSPRSSRRDHGQRRSHAIQLIGGVVLAIPIATLLL